MFVAGQWAVRFRAARLSLSVLALSTPVLAQVAPKAPAASPALAPAAAPAVAQGSAQAPAAATAPVLPPPEPSPAAVSTPPAPEQSVENGVDVEPVGEVDPQTRSRWMVGPEGKHGLDHRRETEGEDR